MVGDYDKLSHLIEGNYKKITNITRFTHITLAKLKSSTYSINFFFLEYAGELRIFVLRRRKGPITVKPYHTLDQSEGGVEKTLRAITYKNGHLRTRPVFKHTHGTIVLLT